MKTWHRFTFAAVACATALTLACSGKTDGAGGGDGGGSSGGSSGGGSGSSSSGGAPGGCDDYFTAIYGPCFGGAQLPASEMTRLQGRFDTLCAEALALPGDAVTSDALATCAAAVKSSGCSILNQTQGPCGFATGTLPAAAACVTGGQCQGGDCTAGNTTADGGMSVCGVCVAAAGIGQPCGSGQSCGPDATCNGSTGGGATCVAITHGGVGVACNGSSTQCNPGLFCDSSTQKCATPGAAGAACQLDEDCAAPLICPAGVTGVSTCQMPGGAGASCVDDPDCASGLGCGQTTRTCSTVTFAMGGQTCSDYVRCLVGSCPFTNGTGGTCPTVIPDGQACTSSDTSSTCDTYATCDAGKCLLGYPTCP